MSSASKVIRPEIQAMHAYQVSDATGLVKLDVMESPASPRLWPCHSHYRPGNRRRSPKDKEHLEAQWK